ncbi:MAG: CAP domain-containing protein [Phycisphaerae bacterium]
MVGYRFSFILLTGSLFYLLPTMTAHSATVIRRTSIPKLAVPDSAKTVPSTQYSHGEPTDQEQYMLELVNRARANPAGECKFILASDDPKIQNGLKLYKIDSNELTEKFSSYAEKPPLAFNPQLIDSARYHSQDMATHDFQDHSSSDGSTLSDRLHNAGYDYYLGGENVFAYSYSSFYAQAAFLIDWGVDDLGHRKNLLDLDPDGHTQFREIGIGITSESDPHTAVGPLVITQDFGLIGTQTVFITGVAYRDTNANNLYDPGEGLAGVAVMPDHGEYYAVTSSSGGFAIPVAASSGNYTLKIIQSDLPEVTADVTIENENVKIDFPLDLAATQTEDNQTVPPQGATITKTISGLLGIPCSIPAVGLLFLLTFAGGNIQERRREPG